MLLGKPRRNPTSSWTIFFAASYKSTERRTVKLASVVVVVVTTLKSPLLGVGRPAFPDDNKFGEEAAIRVGVPQPTSGSPLAGVP